MTPSEYLNKTLDGQTLGEEGDLLQQLRDRRKEVEDHLRSDFGSSPSIQFGGSKAKGTMIKEAYDLDIVCYFPRDDDDAGGTLETIFENVRASLSKKYVAIPKTSAVRLQSLDYADFHIDVVPGRYVENEQGDVFLHRTSGDKQRLKTNLQVHVNHVRKSGVVPLIRVMKLWRVRQGLPIRHFALELLTIKVAESRKSADLATQARHVWETLRDNVDSISIEDPANPTGNVLSGLLNDAIRAEMAAAAKRTLSAIDQDGWESVFGKLTTSDEAKKVAIDAAAKAVVSPPRPWCRE